MRIAVAQLDQVVGDLAGNAGRLLDALRSAERVDAALVATPELSLCGYPPEDLLLRRRFLEANHASLVALAAEVRDTPALIGFPELSDGCRYNACALARRGRVERVYRKSVLPNFTVFDEQRYFAAGDEPCVFEAGGMRVGVIVCEDAWHAWPARRARDAGAELVVVANASPYHTAQHARRREAMAARASETGLPFVYVNRVGGQDELVFDGASFVSDARGDVVQQMPAWQETIAVVDFDGATPRPVRGSLDAGIEPNVYQALVMGVRDYVHRNRFAGAIVGVSGGIDSALTLAVAVDALGADRVRAVMLPSRYTSEISLHDARELAGLSRVRYDEIPIEPPFAALLDVLEPLHGGLAPDVTEENLQARVRGTLLMALSNKSGWLVLTTGNKSEMAVGYATLYGDMAGGFAVLKDVPKTLVYRLARHRNALGRVMPDRVLSREPTAELAFGQRDRDSLPDYAVLDAILEAHVENDLDAAAIVAKGLPEADVVRVLALVRRAEHKRRQSAVGVRVTPRAFGKDWRLPIASAWTDA